MTATKKLTDTQLMTLALVGVYLQVLGNFFSGMPETALSLLSGAICAYALVQMYRAGWFDLSYLRRKR